MKNQWYKYDILTYSAPQAKMYGYDAGFDTKGGR
jgi:hypothetical protein